MSTQTKWKLLGVLIVVLAVGVLGWQQFAAKPMQPVSPTTISVTPTVTVTTTATVVWTLAAGYDLIRDFLLPAAGWILTTAVALGSVALANRLSEGSRRRERLSEEIYEPLLGQLDLICEQFERGENPDLGEFEKTIDRPKFLKIDQETRKLTKETGLSISLCKQLYLHANSAAETVIKEEIDKFVKEGKLSSTLHGQAYDVTYRAFIGTNVAGGEKLLNCLIMGRSPYLTLLERTLGLTEDRIDCVVSGHPKPIDKQIAKDLAQAVLNRWNTETNLRIYRSNIERLIQKEIKPLTERLKEESESKTIAPVRFFRRLTKLLLSIM